MANRKTIRNRLSRDGTRRGVPEFQKPNGAFCFSRELECSYNLRFGRRPSVRTPKAGKAKGANEVL